MADPKKHPTNYQIRLGKAIKFNQKSQKKKTHPTAKVSGISGISSQVCLRSLRPLCPRKSVNQLIYLLVDSNDLESKWKVGFYGQRARPAKQPILVPSLTRKRAKEGDALVKLDVAFTIDPKWIIVSAELSYLPKLPPRRPLSLDACQLICNEYLKKLASSNNH